MSGYAPINELLTVTASAGSGKTYRIAKEFIKWCLSEAPELRVYRNILAVTFTNKATAEMKERILRALKGIANQHFEEKTDEVMAEEIRAELELSQDEFKSRARAVLFKILHDYTNLSITTIDSFSYRLVSTFAHDLNLPANFEVELNFGNVLNTGIDLLIEKAGAEGEELLTKVLLNFVAFQLDEEDKGLQVKGKITEAGKALEYLSKHEGVLIKEGATLEQLIEEFQSLRKEVIAFRHTIRQKAAHLSAFMKEKGIDPELSLRKCISKLTNLAYLSTLSELPGAFTASVSSILEGGSFYTKTNAKVAAPMFDPWENELRRFMTDFDQLLEQYYSREGLTELVVKNYYPTILLGSLAREIEILKKNDRKLHISDFSKYIEEVVKEPAPFIYERMGERFRAFLLDEFQDTSQIQWNNIKPLVENALSQEEKNKVMVVGDAKQSIYAWRGAEVNLILALMKDRTEGPYAIRSEALKMNYRSLPMIVGFNNDLFSYVAAQLQNARHADLYRRGTQKPHKSEPEGYVSLMPKQDVLEEQVLEIIVDALERNYSPRDIAVLVRNKGDATKIQVLLQEKGIAYSTGKGNVLDEDPYVMATLCLLQLVCTAHSDSALSRLATAVSKDEQGDIFSKSIRESVSGFLNMVMSKYDFRSFLWRYFSLAQVSQNGIYEAALDILRHFHEAPKVSSLYQTWLSRLRNFEHAQSNSVAAYLRYYWEESEVRLYNGESAEDKILIETIHSSKGLQYPVVIVPKADWSMKPSVQDILSIELPERFSPLLKVRMKYNKVLPELHELESDQEKLRESAQLGAINMLYVALTRAQNELYVIYPAIQKIEEIGSVNHLLQAYTATIGGQIEQGKKLLLEPKEKQEEAALPEFANEGWRSRIFISWKALKSLDEEGINPQEWGKLVHGILAKADNSAQVRELVSELRDEGVMSAMDIKALEESALAFMEHEAFKPYWNLPGKRISERELVSGDKRILRPDKVIEHQGRYTIIDFKTGEPSEKHRTQMDEYGKALSDMSAKPSLKVLMYLRNQEVVAWE